MSEDLLQFVTSSTVRTQVLRGVSNEPKPTREFLNEIDGSTSAIYVALNELDSRALIAENDEQWSVTSKGQIVADIVMTGRRSETVLREMDEYLRNHDITVLPRRFRLRIGSLTGTKVVRATQTNPQRVVKFVAQHLEDASNPRIMSPVYIDSFAESLPGLSGTKLLLDEKVVTDTVQADVGIDESVVDTIGIRIGRVPIALTVTDEFVLLSLPKNDGQYDPQSEIFIKTEDAQSWGRELFDMYWSRAISPEQFETE